MNSAAGLTAVSDPSEAAPSGSPMIDLGKNENPFPLPEIYAPAVLDAAAELHRYPNDGDLRSLADAIAEHYGVDRRSILICRGVDEAVDLVIGEFGDTEFTVVTPGFDGFVDRLNVFHKPHHVLRLNAAFEPSAADVEGLGERSFTVLANPNNPTGHLFAQPTIDHIAARSGMTLVDEAYIEFADRPSLIDRARGRLMVYRSLSKAYGLAGLRAGFLFGEPSLIKRLSDAQRYFGVDLLAVAVMRCALRSYPVDEIVGRILVLRRELLQGLRELGLRAYDSQANFILVRDDRAAPLSAKLEKLGIQVRDTASMGLPGHVRVSVGSAENNRRLLDALKSLC